jgi:hypothetical protein
MMDDAGDGSSQGDEVEQRHGGDGPGVFAAFITYITCVTFITVASGTIAR